MNNPMPDPNMPDDQRHTGDDVEAFLHRFPNVIAFVSGHTHVNRVTAYPDPAGRSGGFWQINTAAHIDAPQHARIVEVVDNGDGTLSIFGTLIDHAGPAQAAIDDFSPLALASHARELSWNDPQAHLASALGEPEDRNVELLITRPFVEPSSPAAPAATERPRPAPPAREGPPTPAPDAHPTPAPVAAAAAPSLPSTGGGMGLAGGAAAITAARLLRRRTEADTSEP